MAGSGATRAIDPTSTQASAVLHAINGTEPSDSSGSPSRNNTSVTSSDSRYTTLTRPLTPSSSTRPSTHGRSKQATKRQAGAIQGEFRLRIGPKTPPCGTGKKVKREPNTLAARFAFGGHPGVVMGSNERLSLIATH